MTGGGIPADKEIVGRARERAGLTLEEAIRKLEHLAEWDSYTQVSDLTPLSGLAALLACFLLGLTLIVVRRAAGITGFVVQPRRWVVERSLGWLNRWRRLAKDHEALPEVSEAMVTIAMIRLMLHRVVHPDRKRLPTP